MFQRALADIVYHVAFGRYRPLKLPLSCEVVENRWFLGPTFEGIPQISNIYFQISLTPEHVPGFG